MRILGHGLDLCECSRIAELLERHGERFLERVFTPAEIDYCQPRARRVEHFAGRFAAKEAVLKAIGTGWRGQIAFTDVEIVKDGMGAPLVRLHGAAAVAAHARGIFRFLVSITHVRDMAAASVIALPEGS